MKKPNGKDLFSTTMGSCAGIGTITNAGVAIGMAGSGVILAYLLAFFVMFIANLLITLFVTVHPVINPQYATTSWANKKVAGFWLYCQVFAALAQAYVGVAFGTYVDSTVPAISVQAIACFIVALFFLLSFLDLKSSAVVQNVATVIPLCVLLSFTLPGLPKCDPRRMFSNESLFYGGIHGIFDACANVLSEVDGCTILMNFGPQTESPKRNIPRMTITTFTCAFLAFGLVILVGFGMTPIEEAAGQPMICQAQLICPGSTYVIFIAGSASPAIVTTINPNYQRYWGSIICGVDEGWFPALMDRRNKRGTPQVLMMLFWLTALILSLSNLDTGQLVGLAPTATLIPTLIPIWGFLKLPEGDPEGWRTSRMSKYFSSTASRVVLYTICTLVIGVLVVLNALQLTPAITIFIIVYFAVALIINFTSGGKLMAAGTKRAVALRADE